MKHILPLLTGLLLAPLAALHTAAIGRTMRVMPLPALLRMAGYRTIHVGKAHFGAKDTPGENPLNLGIAENTVILFMSDNGSPSQCPRNLPLRGHKLTPYEGGIREPMLVKWPGVTKPASVCRDPVVIEDFFPTILELAGADWRGKTPQAVDGVSFVPLLRGEGKTPEDRAFVWHFPHHYGGQTPFSAIRQGPWKLIYHHAGQQLELFDLDADIGEARDLAKENPAKVAPLAKLLTDRLRAEKALMPVDKVTGQPVAWPDQAALTPPVVRVACLGDSITFGSGATPRDQYSYPAQLAGLLGNGYRVENFGVGSATLLFHGDKPYRKQPQFQKAMDFDPDIVLLLLGANDTCGEFSQKPPLNPCPRRPVAGARFGFVPESTTPGRGWMTDFTLTELKQPKK